MKHRTLAQILMLLFVSLSLTGCMGVMTPATGLLYTDVKGPHDATGIAPASGRELKVGTSEAVSILTLFATGDASIDAGMRNGGITKIHHVDYHTVNYFLVYSKVTVMVYGE